VDNGKLSELKLPTLDSLVADLLDHDKELKRTKKVNLTLGRRGVGQSSYGSSQQLSNGKHCSHCKRDGHIEKDYWQKHPEKRPKSGHRNKGNRKADNNKSTSIQALTLVIQPTGHVTPATSTRSSASDWCLDSGSYYHCTNDMNDFMDNKYVTVDSGVMVGDSRILKGHALSNVMLPVRGIDGRITEITFTDVLYVPLLNIKLISERLLRSKNMYYSGEKFALYNRDTKGNTNYLMGLKELDGLPHLVLADNYKPRTNSSVMVASRPSKVSETITPKALRSSRTPPSSTATAELWHSRLGHITDRSLNKLDTEGVTIDGDYVHGRCDACSQGKFKKQHSRVWAPRPRRIFDEISVDLVHSTYTALNKERWLTLITDGKSLFRHEFTHSKKSDAGKLIIDHLARIERQTGRKIKRIRIDNGTEFATLVAHCKINGITLIPTTAYNSQQNSRAEVSNYLVEHMARTIIIAGKV
jgi:transposase InsO family protein